MPELQGLPTSQGLPFPGQTVNSSPQVHDQQIQNQINQYPGQQPLLKKPSSLLDQTNSPGYPQIQHQNSMLGQVNYPGPQQNQYSSNLNSGEKNSFAPQQNQFPSNSIPGHANSSGPPQQQYPNLLPGQVNSSGPQNQFPPSFSNPQMMMAAGKQNPPVHLLSGQSNNSPVAPQNLVGPGQPPMGQQNSHPAVSPMPGQQNFSGLLPPGQNQHNHSVMSGPPMPGARGPMMPGQSNLQGPMGGPPMSGQPNLQSPMAVPRNPMAGPPMGGQPSLQSPMAGPPMPGQQNFPSPMGGQNLSGQQYPGQQLHLANNQAPYMSGQGYQNPPDMYANQRSPYGYQQQQQARRLDPDHMPSPIQVIQDDRNTRSGSFITNQKGLVPPLVTTNFTVQDQGNASPRFVRSTMYTVPTNTDIMKQTSVPFSLILSPMARVEEGEYEPPIVDMGEIGPVRCIRCKAYMSPFMQFIDSGRRFQCNFCKATTEVPAEYFQHLDHTGQRMDRYERPELMLGSYEFIATKDYCPEQKFPNPPAVIFVIDVTYNTIKSGLVNLICSEMKNIIRNLPIDVGQTRTRMKVGFITYNNTVHFYNIKSCLAQPQMMVVGDVQDVFMPLLDGFLCDAEESLEVINSLMNQIPNMFADTRETETILAPAIQAGLEALKASECSGKLMVFHSSLPIAEALGKLKNRDDRKLLGTEKEKTVLAPQNNVYNTLGQDCVAAGCSVDLFLVNNSYIDVATIGQVCRLTGGEVYKYTYFQADIDSERLIADIVNNVSRPIGFNAVMRVRTSTGVRPTDFYGHFYMSNTTDVELASIDCDKAIGIEVKHDDKLAEEEGVFVQAALLYTSCSGIRRLRIINLSLRTSSQMAELYRACDLDAMVNFFSKEAVFKLLEHPPKAVKEHLMARCANILAAYRKNCAAPSSAAQLILPECMKLLPLYVNCLMKSHAIFGGADISIDDKSYEMQVVSKMPVHTSVNYFYPRMFSLHTLDMQEIDLSQTLRCSIEKITDDGCYLIENGVHMFLWLGLGLNSQWVQEVFGVPSVVQIDTDRPKIPILDSQLNRKVNDLINRVNDERHPRMRLIMVRQRDKLEMVFRHFLVEDKGTDASASYVDFLCHMHKEIRGLLS
ncbi:protein transport protein Sec24C-like [Leptopilina heterotoma]|uniref:protein transport protein Sec24C-like n=1 Tax=Leptopilina heterotoma TaxID=63436 RepID=UPI001CA912A7|nr:protein transport protein Sec24C-like [Leptopilina heterotoma]